MTSVSIRSTHHGGNAVVRESKPIINDFDMVPTAPHLKAQI
jgi:hypothetical protein